MLREKIRKIFIEKKYRDRVKQFMKFLVFVGLIWLVTFPYVSRNIFTSENALNTQ
jgi:hypothetical protein